MKRKDNTLTKMEFQIMSILWDINHSACAWDILDRMDEPKPAYTTTATFMKILVRKGFCKVTRVGSMQYYTPKITKEEYCQRVMEKAREDYFDGDIVRFVEFLMQHNEVSQDQKNAIVAILR